MRPAFTENAAVHVVVWRRIHVDAVRRTLRDRLRRGRRRLASHRARFARPCRPTGPTWKVAMKRLLHRKAVALAFALVLGASLASADGLKDKGRTPPGQQPLRVELHISNTTTNEGGKFVSGSAGDEITFKLRVKNNRKETVTVECVLDAGIPGCMIQEVETVTLGKGMQAKEIVTGTVPVDESGLLTIDVQCTSSAGDVKSDHAELAFNLGGKATGEAHGGRGGIWQQILVRTLANALLAGLDGDESVAETSISRVKNIYR
jgi:hypothetical protein